MILFLDDWLKYPGACIHYETSNSSFLRVAEIYNQMGIQNCAFHLSLLDSSLKDVDLTRDDLDNITLAKVIVECQRNPWYFFREVLRVPVPGSINPIKFRADRANIALYWLFLNHVLSVLVIQRQTGKTTMLMSLVTYLLDIGTTNSFINLLTKSSSLRTETLQKVKALFEELPDWINFSSKKDIFNNEEVYISAFENTFKGNLSSSSPKQAEKVGRGFVSPIIVIDEAAYISNISIAMSAILMAGNAAREFARQAGKHYGTILATTAGDIDDRDGGYIYKLISNSTDWSERFLDCKNQEELNDIIYKNSNASGNETKRPIVHISFSYRQLGYDEEWLNRRLSEIVSTEENLARDIYNKWLSGSSASPIPKEYIDILRENVREESRDEFYYPYNYLLRWYKTEEEVQDLISSGVSFIVGIDTSDAVGRDDISFIVRDHTCGEIICAASFNEVNLITLSDFFVSFLMKYQNSVMIIERRSSAAAIIDYMIQKLSSYGVNPYTRLYNTIFQNKQENEDDFARVYRAKGNSIEVYNKYKDKIGFVTSGAGTTSRSMLYSATLINMAKYTSHCTYDPKTIRQLSSLIIKNNRVDHPEGGHDDMVIGALLSYWFLINGKNLHYYGVDPQTVMKNNLVYLKEKYSLDEDAVDEQEAIDLEEEFNELLQELKQEKNDIISRQIEVKIRKLSNELNRYNRAISVEQMLQDIQREKKYNRRY